IVGRLQHVQRRDAAEPLHLLNREIAYPDRADLALLEQGVHRLCGFLDRHQRVGPMNLVASIWSVRSRRNESSTSCRIRARLALRNTRAPDHSSPALVAMSTRERR